MIRILKCNRCNYEWATRKITDPKNCPKCKSPYYNKERVIRKVKTGFEHSAEHRFKEKLAEEGEVEI